MSEPSLLEQCNQLEWQDLLRLFAQMLRDSPENTDLPALALRKRARVGQLPEEALPALGVCLAGSENNAVIVEIAKTLAAFGTRAEAAAPILLNKIEAMNVMDDVDFWAFDGCLHALGYIGSEDDIELLKEFRQRPPVTRAGDLYKGSMPKEDREEIFYNSTEVVRERLLTDDPGSWTKRNTNFQSKQQESSSEKHVPAWKVGRGI